MVLLLFPAVRVKALILELAALTVRADDIVDLPFFAHLAVVGEDRWPSPVVLPVMCVDADLPVMVVLAIRTPDSLE